MKNFLFAFLLLAFILPAHAQTPQASPADQAYLAEVDRMRSNPTTPEDWTKLRQLYTESSFYKDMAGFIPVDIKTALSRAYNEKTPETLQALESLRRNHFAALETHIDALNFHSETTPKPDFVTEEKETEAIRNIFDSIKNSGNGHTMKTAFKAISIYEQKAMLQAYFKLQQLGKTLEYANDSIYDVYTVKYDNTPPQEMFFDITERMAAFKHSKMQAQAAAAMEKVEKDKPAVAEEKQEAPAPKLVPAQQQQADINEKYLSLVDTAMQTPEKADWASIRKIFPDTSFYKTVGGQSLGEHSYRMLSHVRNRETEDSIKNFKTYLRQFYASVGAHRTALKLAESYPASDIDTAAATAALSGILKDITQGVSGTSTKEAFKLISPEEMEAVLTEHFKVKNPTAPQVKAEEGIPYAYYSLQDPATKAEQTYYFAIDRRAFQVVNNTRTPMLAGQGAKNNLNSNDVAYNSLVAAALKNPDAADWAALRDAYTRTSNYQPYSSDGLWKAMTHHANIAKEQSSVEAQEEYRKFYLAHFANYIAQQNALKMVKESGIPDISPQTAQKARDGLIKALMDSGDGRTPETAYKVIDIKEEYLILQGLKAKFKKRPVKTIGKEVYDIFDPVEENTSVEPVHFNVTKFFQRP